LQDANGNCATALSILGTIVNFSGSTACVLYCFDLLTEHLHGRGFWNSGHKIANLELLMDRPWLWIFLKLIRETHLTGISVLTKKSINLQQQRHENLFFEGR